MKKRVICFICSWGSYRSTIMARTFNNFLATSKIKPAFIVMHIGVGQKDIIKTLDKSDFVVLSNDMLNSEMQEVYKEARHPENIIHAPYDHLGKHEGNAQQKLDAWGKLILDKIKLTDSSRLRKEILQKSLKKNLIRKRRIKIQSKVRKRTGYKSYKKN